MTSRIEDLQKSFERELRAEGKAGRTIELYGQSVVMFAAWLEAQGRPATLDELNRAAVREWLATLGEKGLSANTVRTRFRGLRRFCGWLVDEDELRTNPMEKLSPPSPKPEPVPVVSDEDLKRLLRTCESRTFADRRDQAMFRVLLDTGIRVGELVGMTTTALKLDQAMTVVAGKTGPRAVYLSDKTVRALDRYLRIRSAHRHRGLEALWITQRGALSADGARARFEVRCDEAGLARIHPHQLRHTWAADFLANGGQERDAMRLAGWSSDAMLSRYGSATADARAAAAARQLKRGDRV